MTSPTYDAAPAPVRDDIVAAHRSAWRRIAGPGNWFDGATRVAIATESRAARQCALCADRKEALSPFAVEGTHDSVTDLPETMVEVVHRIVTDPARLRRQWYDDMLAGGLTETEYVEIVGVTCSTVSVDTFARAMGLPAPDLPTPEPGEPSRVCPAGVKPGDAWVPWIGPGDATGDEADLYAHGASNIRRALTSVPGEQRGFFELAHAQYLDGAQIQDVGTNYRAITRPQIELIAGRVSALNQCVY